MTSKGVGDDGEQWRARRGTPHASHSSAAPMVDVIIGPKRGGHLGWRAGRWLEADTIGLFPIEWEKAIRATPPIFNFCRFTSFTVRERYSGTARRAIKTLLLLILLILPLFFFFYSLFCQFCCFQNWY